MPPKTQLVNTYPKEKLACLCFCNSCRIFRFPMRLPSAWFLFHFFLSPGHLDHQFETLFVVFFWVFPLIIAIFLACSSLSYILLPQKKEKEGGKNKTGPHLSPHSVKSLKVLFILTVSSLPHLPFTCQLSRIYFLIFLFLLKLQTVSHKWPIVSP